MKAWSVTNQPQAGLEIISRDSNQQETIKLNKSSLSYKDYASILLKLFKRSKNQKVQATGVRLDSLNEIDVELDWIHGVKDQVDFLNANMKYHSILFRVERRELVGVVAK
jgi:hypothetical protein